MISRSVRTAFLVVAFLVCAGSLLFGGAMGEEDLIEESIVDFALAEDTDYELGGRSLTFMGGSTVWLYEEAKTVCSGLLAGPTTFAPQGVDLLFDKGNPEATSSVSFYPSGRFKSAAWNSG